MDIDRQVDYLGSPVINVARLPISWISAVIPCTSGFYGNWVEYVRAIIIIIIIIQDMQQKHASIALLAIAI